MTLEDVRRPYYTNIDYVRIVRVRVIKIVKIIQNQEPHKKRKHNPPLMTVFETLSLKFGNHFGEKKTAGFQIFRDFQENITFKNE